MPTRSVKEMVVVITGASAVIGKALAEQLSRRGARLVLAARRLERLETLNRVLGGGHLCVQTDVARTEDCRDLIDRSFDAYGRIDTLVLNAGYGIYKPFVRTTLEEARAIFSANVFGTTDCLQLALPRMSRQAPRDGCRGQIMITSSCVARRGVPFLGLYAATKAAQLALAEAVRSELQPLRIAVTSVHPIQTHTEFGQAAASGEINWPKTPMGQTAEQVADRMVAAIIKPRAEVWPNRPSRWAFSLATLFPGLVDRAMNSHRRKVERENPGMRSDATESK